MNNFLFYPYFPQNCQKPPTIFSILESIVNPDVDLNDPAPTVKIKDLAKEGRTTIFNFDYPLSNNVSREAFETMLLNHFLMRRIGFETVTAFRIQLDVKLNEIMPIYNKMFDALENWNIFDGEKTIRTGSDERKTENITNSTNNTTSNNTLNNESTTSSSNISDRRHSDTPQNQLENVKDGSYVTDYNYDTNENSGSDNSKSSGNSESNANNNSNSNTNDNNKYEEITNRTVSDKITILKEMQTNIKNIYTLIFDELECLFYQLV